VHRLGLATLTLLLGAVPAAHSSDTDVPRVDVVYSAGFDEGCAFREEEPLDPAAVTELDQLLPRLEEAWRRDGPELLVATREVVGQPFRFRKTTARVLTCGVPSRSHPLAINVRPYLAATAGGQRTALPQFARTVFHELLHRYVMEVMAQRGLRDTPLLRKYGAEPEEVRDHLHLFAIEEAVYRRAGRERELAEVKSFEATLIKARLFARGRQIVRAEGAQAFLDELRTQARAGN
jgi:hypothetical protein